MIYFKYSHGIAFVDLNAFECQQSVSKSTRHDWERRQSWYHNSSNILYSKSILDYFCVEQKHNAMTVVTTNHVDQRNCHNDDSNDKF